MFFDLAVHLTHFCDRNDKIDDLIHKAIDFRFILITDFQRESHRFRDNVGAVWLDVHFTAGNDCSLVIVGFDMGFRRQDALRCSAQSIVPFCHRSSSRVISHAGKCHLDDPHAEDGIHDPKAQAFSVQHRALFDVKLQHSLDLIKIPANVLQCFLRQTACVVDDRFAIRPVWREALQSLPEAHAGIADKLVQIGFCVDPGDEFAAGHGRTKAGAFFFCKDHQLVVEGCILQ